MCENIQWAMRTSSKLGDFLRSGDCCDLELRCSNNESIPCHKLILCLVSDTLKTTLHGSGQNSEVHLKYISDQPKTFVNELLVAFYTGKIVINKSSYQAFYRIAGYYGIDWMLDSTRRWIEDSVVRLFGLDFLAFACAATNNIAVTGQSDRTFLKLIDSYGFEEHFKNLKIDGDFQKWGLCDLDSGVVRNILKFSNFETDCVKINFVLYWLETNQAHTKDMLNVIISDVDFVSLLRANGDSFLEMEDKIKDICPPALETLVSETFGNAISHTYVDKINSRNIDSDLLAVDLKVFKFLMTSSELTDVGKLSKIKFAVEWLKKNPEHLGESEHLIMSSIALDELYACDAVLYKDIKQLFGEGSTETKMKFNSIFSNFKENISNSKKLLKLACSDRWKEFECNEILDLMQKFESGLDVYSILGMFGEWIMGSEKRSKYKTSWGCLFKAFPNLASQSVHSQFLEHFKIAGLWNLQESKKENAIWDYEEESKILNGLSTSEKTHLVFYDGIFPPEERMSVPDDEENGIATIKRQAGQFTKGSRTVIFKSDNRVLKIGLDESRTPYLFPKLQTGLTRARRASQEPVDDISHKFVTVYGMISDCFINIPFLDPEHLENVILKTREDGADFRIVVIIKCD